MLKGFTSFLARGNVINLAVAVVMGVAFGAVVASLVSDLLTPLIAAIFGKPDFSRLTFTINHSTFYYGRFFNALLSFLTVAGTVYFVVIKPLERLGLTGAAPKPSPEAELLAEIRDSLRQRESLTMQREDRDAPASGKRAG